MMAGQLALIIAALFTGAAFYVSFAEQSARLGLDDRALLAEWKPAYKRGYSFEGEHLLKAISATFRHSAARHPNQTVRSACPLSAGSRESLQSSLGSQAALGSESA